MISEWMNALAQAGGAAIVAAAATDAWQTIRDGVVRIFAPDDPERRAIVSRRLDDTAATLTTAEPADAQSVSEHELLAWRTRLADLLSERPEAADSLRAMITQAEVATRNQNERTGTIVQGNSGGVNIAVTGMLAGGIRLDQERRSSD